MTKKQADPVGDIDRAERAVLAVRMRRQGYQYDEIAAACGYASRSGAHGAVKSAMIAARDELYGEADLYRIESIDRLTELLKAAWPYAVGEHVGPDGEKVKTAPNEKFIAEARRLISQIDDLTGAKAPVKYDFGEGDVDRLLRDAEAEIGRRAIAAEVEASHAESP